MVVPGQDIDAILGMNWLRIHGVVLNLKQKSFRMFFLKIYLVYHRIGR
jgi:hypothetical protein